MTRDEWFNSTEFMKQRLMNNIASEVKFKLQHLRDLLAIYANEKGVGVGVISDRFTLADRQLKIGRAHV